VAVRDSPLLTNASIVSADFAHVEAYTFLNPEKENPGPNFGVMGLITATNNCMSLGSRSQEAPINEVNSAPSRISAGVGRQKKKKLGVGASI
jgi:hypothetical protein